MISFDDMTPDWIDQNFGPAAFDFPCTMRPLPDAHIIWFNRRAAEQSACLRSLGLPPAAYPDYVLRSCAFVIENETCGDGTPDASPRPTAYADRYGGEGIGTNGGSGRAVIINGFHIKGVGRTGLVGLDCNAAHASGSAFLEEAVREAIFSELCALEYPAGAIPIIAIIDTGKHVVWDTKNGPKRETMVLIVRPVMYRPAHIERALLYISPDRWAGAEDAKRVGVRVNALYSALGGDGVKAALIAWAEAWADQMAYGFVHRLPHAAHSTSNVTLSGALMDFGACTSVPSWARFLLLQSGERFGSEFLRVIGSLRSIIETIYFATDRLPFESNEIKIAATRLQQAFEKRVAVEVLRHCGLSETQAGCLLEKHGHARVFQVTAATFRTSQQELFELTKDSPVPCRGFNFADVYLAAPPSNLIELRQLLLDWLPASALAGAQARAAFINRPRPQLYREAMKDRIYREVEGDFENAQARIRRIEEFIFEEIAAGRRDFGAIPDDAVPVGFAAGPSIHATLFQQPGKPALTALIDAADSTSSSLLDAQAAPEHTRTRMVSVARANAEHHFMTFDSLPSFRVQCALMVTLTKTA